MGSFGEEGGGLGRRRASHLLLLLLLQLAAALVAAAAAEEEAADGEWRLQNMRQITKKYISEYRTRAHYGQHGRQKKSWKSHKEKKQTPHFGFFVIPGARQ